MSELRKYYDIEYTATAYAGARQRVYLDNIEHDDFSNEALEDAKREVEMNPDCDLDLSGDWEMLDEGVEIQEWEEGDNTWECVLCNEMYIGGFGNNPEPIVDTHALETFDARCCDACNTNVVIPARFKEMQIANKAG